MRWIGGGMDTRNLERRRQGWYCVKDVPAALVPLIHRKRLRVSLKTRELRVALRRRHEALHRFEQLLAKATSVTDHDALFEEALELRQLRGDRTVVARVPIGTDGAVEEVTAADLLPDHAERLEDAARLRGHPDPASLGRVAFGLATPIGPRVDEWLREADIEARSKGDHRRAIRELIAWAATSHLPPMVEAFTRKVAGRYVSTLLNRHGDRTTVTKRLWSLSSLWRWLIAKGDAMDNPWRGHDVGQGGRSTRDKEPERAFTDQELATLLAGPADRTMRDVIRLAALSGLRLEEIALLQVRDLDLGLGTMTVREDPKTPSARRAVPIHPEVLAMVVERANGQPDEAFVIAEFGDVPKEGRQRSMAFSKRFGRYRQEVGVHEKRDGQRRSLVNFHSLRRWFITKAEHAGQPENVIRSVVGHKRPGVTLGVYSAGPSLEQRRGCVGSVNLPNLVACRNPT